MRLASSVQLSRGSWGLVILLLLSRHCLRQREPISSHFPAYPRTRVPPQPKQNDTHCSTYHLQLAVGLHGGGGDVHGGGPGGGAAGVAGAVGAAGAAGAVGVAGAAGVLPGDDTGGFASALLPAHQTAALFNIPRAELRKLLDAAGLPYGPGTPDADLRIKCAAAVWAAKKLRSAGEFHALPDGVEDHMLNALEVPAAWRTDARHQAMLNLLQACRSPSWALDPSLSRGLDNRERSELLRLGEQFAAGPRGSGATPSQLLSPQEYSDLLASIASAGYSEQDLVLSQGRWTLDQSRAQQRGVGACAGAALAGHDSADKIEAELRTLYIQPNSLLMATERKDPHSRSKTTPTKRSAAYPGDTETDVADPSLHPFAEWPWEQHFRVTLDLPSRRAGRILKNGLPWCNKDCTCPLMNVTFETRSAAADWLYEQFSMAVSGGSHDRALLVAQLALAEATEQMKAVLTNAQMRAAAHPLSKMLVYVAERRLAQSIELKTYLADINTRVT